MLSSLPAPAPTASGHWADSPVAGAQQKHALLVTEKAKPKPLAATFPLLTESECFISLHQRLKKKNTASAGY